SSYGDHRDLHSFPTRRSSDLDHAAEMIRGGAALLLALAQAPAQAPVTPEGCQQDLRAAHARFTPWPLRPTPLPNGVVCAAPAGVDRKSTRLNSSHDQISYAVF